MTKTYTPLIIEGKIYVVVDAPGRAVKSFNEIVAKCTKYETLPEHAPYWEERIGQRLGESDFRYAHGLSGMDHITYAIPPQQKQGDEWDEIQEIIVRHYEALSQGWKEEINQHFEVTIKRK